MLHGRGQGVLSHMVTVVHGLDEGRGVLQRGQEVQKP